MAKWIVQGFELGSIVIIVVVCVECEDIMLTVLAEKLPQHNAF